MAHQMNASGSEMVEQSHHVVGHLDTKAGLLVKLAALARPAHIECDHSVIERERVAKTNPVFEVACQAVEQDDRLTAAGLAVAQAHVAGREEPVGSGRE